MTKVIVFGLCIIFEIKDKLIYSSIELYIEIILSDEKVFLGIKTKASVLSEAFVLLLKFLQKVLHCILVYRKTHHL